MKSIKTKTIRSEVSRLLLEASFNLPQDIVEAIKNACKIETDSNAKKVLYYILQNEKIARNGKLPLCQDCGVVYINIGIGSDIYIEDSENIKHELNRAVADVYRKNYLRNSIVNDPVFDRKNTGDNTPAIISIDFTSDAGIGVEVNLKGGGSENCSYLYMLNPSASEDEIVGIVLDIVKKNVTRCCPPGVIGIGIGSTASKVTELARRAAFRNLKIRSSDSRYSSLEEKILKAVNKTGIGPQGLGGSITALACNIEFAPCHMATLPLSVFMGCHSTRRASSKISPP
ncbi:MAG: fumarate hydratase [Actinobacteria bacterium]|nr:fumarate hydratase [Actinomycetota bacterium]